MTQEATSTYGVPSRETYLDDASQRGNQAVEEAYEVPTGSLMDSALAELDEATEDNLVRFNHPVSEAFSLEFNCVISSEEMKRYQESATQNRKARRARGNNQQSADQFKISMMVVREKSNRIFFKGTVLTEDNGEPMTLNSPAFLEFVKRGKNAGGVYDQSAAVEHFLGGGGGLMSIGEGVLGASGYGEEAMTVDP